MSTLFLIRHGQASFEAADYDDLSDLGRRQSRLLGAWFIQAGHGFDACWSGTLRRHRQTADEVREVFREAGRKMPRIEEMKHLDEYDAKDVLAAFIPRLEKGDPDFRRDVARMRSSRRAFQRVFARTMTSWVSGCEQPEGIPSWLEFSQGVVGAVGKLIRDCPRGSRVAVFSSGGPISALVGDVLGLPPEATMDLSWQLVNACLSRIQFSPGRMSLASFNEQGHLEGSGEPGLVTYR